MKERIIKFLREENKKPALFADEIGVQASGISHIISGRNNPSLDFIIKMLERYNYLSADWLLFGKGEMYKIKQNPSLFGEHNLFTYTEDKSFKHSDNLENKDGGIITTQIPQESNEKSRIQKNVSKIVWFYDDNTFEEFTRGE